MVVLRDLQKLKQLQPDVRAMEQVLAGTDAFAFYLLAPGGEQPGVHWHARMIERGGEDPATGSAAGCGIAHLVARGRVPPGVEQRFEQGLEIQRPSTLHVRAELGGAGARSVRVGGRVTRLGSGEWVLP